MTADRPLFTRQFALACAMHFSGAMALSLYILFPLFLKSLGATEFVIGVYTGAMGAAAVAARFPVGRLLDTRGRRQVLLGAGLLHAVSWAAFLWIDALGVVATLLVVAHGVAGGALFGSYFTYASDIVPEGRRSEGIAMFGIWGMLPNGLGPLLGEWLIGWRGYTAYFWTATGLAFLSVLITTLLPETAHPPHPSAPPSPQRTRLDLRPIAMLLVVTFCFGVAINSVFTFLAPYAYAHGRGSVGDFFLSYSLAAVTVRIVGGRLPDRIGLYRVLIPALMLLSVAVAIVPHVERLPLWIAVGALCGAGHGYAFPILTVLASEGMEPKQRGRAVSWFTAMFDLGTTIGNPLLGAIAERAGYAAMYAVAASGVFIASLALWRRNATR